MRSGWVLFILLAVGLVVRAFSDVNESHQFSENQCVMCHMDINKNAGDLKPIVSPICEECHADVVKKLSHPVDILPEGNVPADMPLVYGKVSCITCHFVHPFSVEYKNLGYFLLRRPGKGPAFCSACHRIDEKGHIVFENVHLGSYQVTDRNSTLDPYTLQCIECHDKYLDDPLGALGAGTWKHFASSGLNHPVGISLIQATTKKPREFNPIGTLPAEIRLFNGKIGCGTCHNVYSKEKYMLVVSNWRSRLCLVCHNK